MTPRCNWPPIYGPGELLDQLARADARLHMILSLLAQEAADFGCRVRLTSVERTVDETRALYERAGRTPPSGPGVHDVRPARGADLIPDPRGSGAGPLVADRVNKIVVYPRGYKAVVWHDVGDGLHWHVQVPWDGLELLPDPLDRQAVAWGDALPGDAT